MVEISSLCWLVSVCCVDSIKSVALLCTGFLAPCELERLASFSDLLGDLTRVESALSLRDFVAETPRSVVLLLTTRLGDSAVFEATFSPSTNRTCFVSRGLLSLVGCFIGDALPVLLALVCGFVATAARSLSAAALGGRVDDCCVSLTALCETRCDCDGA